jgi:mannose/fructose-specific phosphotransferase system component IIA
MISGVNLYMLICAFSHRQRLPLSQLVEKIVMDGQKSIRDIRAMFLVASAGGR